MDLFDAIDSLFTKKPIEDYPSDFMLHRFLASQQEYAPFCYEINRNVRKREFVWEIWKSALPKAANSPYLPYPAPKKQYVDDPFIRGLCDALDIDIEESQEVARIVELAGKKQDIASYYGIEI